MSNRRNFLAIMAGTASLGVLSSFGRGVSNPSYAQNPSCSVNNEQTKERTKEGMEALDKLSKTLESANREVVAQSGSRVLIASLSDKNGVKLAQSNMSAQAILKISREVEKATDKKIQFWSKPVNAVDFIRGAAASAQKQEAEALKATHGRQKIAEAVTRSLTNLKKKDTTAIENDPIVGSVVRAGYQAAMIKLREASVRQRSIDQLRRDLRNKMAIQFEAEAVRLKQRSKLTNQDIQRLSMVYPPLAPSFRKALDVRLSLDTSDGDLGSTTSSQNIFDTYAQIFERRLLSLDTPINGEGDLTLVDKLMGIEKANACELICFAVILACVIVAGIIALVVTAAVSDADTNQACLEQQRIQQKAEERAACENRAVARRQDRLNTRRKDLLEYCSKPDLDKLCEIAQHTLGDDIEGDYVRDSKACS